MIEKKEIKPGDIVTLKSGGLKMTVACYRPLHAEYKAEDGNKPVICNWFDNDNICCEGFFFTAQLELYMEPVK